MIPTSSTNGSSSQMSNGVHSARESDAWSRERSFAKDDYVRLIMQALQALGYSATAQSLEKEAGIQLQSQDVSLFREAVLSGDWKTADELLHRLEILDEPNMIKAKFLLYRQKFLEYLEQSQHVLALECLRTEISVLGEDAAHVHKLTSLIVCRSPQELYEKSDWDGAAGKSRTKLLSELQAYISPSLLIPERRLEVLVEHGLQYQISNCLYHNTGSSPLSLFSDHTCSRAMIPRYTREVLEQHTDEVWFVAFSHNGKYLASASKDKTVILWNLEQNTTRTLAEHTDAVSFVAWSPDDSKILSCGNDNLVKLWNTATGECERTYNKHVDAVTACAWLPCGRKFVSGGQDKFIHMWDISQPSVLKSWHDIRVHDLALSRDGRRMVAVCTEKLVHVFDLVEKTEFCLAETDNLTSLCLSHCGRYLLVNISTEEVHLWDLNEKAILQYFRGQKQGHYVIRSTFGGSAQAFVLSGSEDSQVYLWHRQTGKLLATLPGHAGTINSVSWHPHDPHTFASASDDNTIRLWGVNPLPNVRTWTPAHAGAEAVQPGYHHPGVLSSNPLHSSFVDILARPGCDRDLV